MSFFTINLYILRWSLKWYQFFQISNSISISLHQFPKLDFYQKSVFKNWWPKNQFSPKWSVFNHFSKFFSVSNSFLYVLQKSVYCFSNQISDFWSFWISQRNIWEYFIKLIIKKIDQSKNKNNQFYYRFLNYTFIYSLLLVSSWNANLRNIGIFVKIWSFEWNIDRFWNPSMLGIELWIFCLSLDLGMGIKYLLLTS